VFDPNPTIKIGDGFDPQAAVSGFAYLILVRARMVKNVSPSQWSAGTLLRRLSPAAIRPKPRPGELLLRLPGDDGKKN
jgi:hypothetical protein